jgi:hypothetical protein
MTFYQLYCLQVTNRKTKIRDYFVLSWIYLKKKTSEETWLFHSKERKTKKFTLLVMKGNSK